AVIPGPKHGSNNKMKPDRNAEMAPTHSYPTAYPPHTPPYPPARQTQPSRRRPRFVGAGVLTAAGLLFCATLMEAQNYAPAKCAPPPDGKYSETALKNYHSSFPNLAVPDGWSVRHGGFDACIDPPGPGGTQDHHFGSSVDLHLA